jgi:hypothetical protein
MQKDELIASHASNLDNLQSLLDQEKLKNEEEICQKNFKFE